MMFWNGLFSLHLTLTGTSVLPLPQIFLQDMLLISTFKGTLLLQALSRYYS
jgi:hypothetical protein